MALNKGSNVHYLLVRALEAAGLSLADIEPVYLPPADARAAFERGAVDAWVIWDPFLAAAQAATGARTLADGTGLVEQLSVLPGRAGLRGRPSRAVVQAILEEIDDGRPLGRRQHRPRSRAAARARASAFPAPVLEVALDRHRLRRPAAHDRRRRPSSSRSPTPSTSWACCPSRSPSRDAVWKATRMNGPSRREAADVLWFLPTHGDGRYLGTSQGAREVVAPPTCARSPRRPTSSATTASCCRPAARCEDSWVVASALAPLTERLRFLVAVRPGLQTPAVGGADGGDARPDLRTAGC